MAPLFLTTDLLTCKINQNGVDLMLFAHEHLYERHWPVYNKTVFKKGVGTDEMASYTNPLAPVHITTGSAVSLFNIKY